jgi:hypothetical protein
MTRKFGGQQDCTIGKLEAQWWADGDKLFSTTPPEQWCWRLQVASTLGG